MRYRSLSFWLDSLVDGEGDLSPRAALDADRTVDVAIVGGGLTGLWTAYYLKEAEPSLSIAVFEAEVVGFGASGRNGGWGSALFPTSTTDLARRHGRAAAIALRRAMIETVEEVGRVVRTEGIECDFVQGGTLAFVRSEPQRRRADTALAEAVEFGVDALARGEVADTPGIAGATGVVIDPACARVQPARLVRALARIVEGRGVPILEQSRVTGIEAGVIAVRTTAGAEHRVNAGTIVLATEAWALPGSRDRSIMPLYSLMVATEPLSEQLWEQIGIRHGQTFTDYRHLLVYGQRTADNRIAFGGRGARYHLGNAIRPEYDRVPAVFEHLRRAIAELIPAVADTAISHAWGGPLGVPRDWHSSVRFDDRNRLWRAGGYVGDGVGTSNLAGRTLAGLITGTATELAGLPIVGHRSPRWEPEPLRFLGANAGLLSVRAADAEERLTGRPSAVARLAAPVIGH